MVVGAWPILQHPWGETVKGKLQELQLGTSRWPWKGSLQPAFFFFWPFRATPKAYGISQARCRIQLPAYTTAIATPDLSHVCDLYHSSGQHLIPNPPSEARDQTHILMDSSWICFAEPQWELPMLFFSEGRGRNTQGSGRECPLSGSWMTTVPRPTSYSL